MIEIRLGCIQYDFTKLNVLTGVAPVKDVVVSEFFDEYIFYEIKSDDYTKEEKEKLKKFKAGREKVEKKDREKQEKDFLENTLGLSGFGEFKKGTKTRKIKYYTHLRIPVRDKEKDEWMHEGADIIFRISKEHREKIKEVSIERRDGSVIKHDSFSKKEEHSGILYQIEKNCIVDWNREKHKTELVEYDYYFPPRKWKIKNDKYEPRDRHNHYTTSGTEEITISYKDGTYDVITLNSVSPLEEEDYLGMVSDLYSMSEELVKSKNGTIDISKQKISDLESIVNKVEKAFFYLKDNFVLSLIQENEKIPVNKMKHFSNKSIIEMDSGKPKVSGVIYKENPDNYENRQIKKFLVDLLDMLLREKKLIGKDRYDNMISYEEKKFLNEKRSLVNDLAKTLDEDMIIINEFVEKALNGFDKEELNESLLNELSELYKKEKRYFNEKNRKGYYDEYVERIKNLICLREKQIESCEKIKEEYNNQNKYSDVLEDLIKRVDKILKHKVFKDISRTNLPLKKTNIFSGNDIYRRFHQIMSNYLELEGASKPFFEYGDTDDITVEKLEVLYERWCLIRLLMLFVDEYGFRFTGSEGHKKTYSYEESKKKLKGYIDYLIQKGDIKDSEFRLEKGIKEVGKLKDNRFSLVIKYNHEFEIPESIDKSVFPPDGEKDKKKLIPDIYIEMNIENPKPSNEGKLETRCFCLDAKYRTKNPLTGNNGKSRWFSDLCSVAIQKYYFEMNEAGHKVDGSFILHSNSECHFKGINSSGYYGARYMNNAGYSMKTIEMAYKEYQKPWMKERESVEISSRLWHEMVDEGGSKKIKYMSDETKEDERFHNRFHNSIYKYAQNFGSILFIPTNISYMKNLVTMIMEHYFGIYFWLCWECGHEIKYGDIKDFNDNSIDHTAIDVTTAQSIRFVCPECNSLHVRNYCGVCALRRRNNEKIPLTWLGKHKIPYYAYSNNKWNLFCPKCNNSI